jgi:capsular polysaccharide biosynthesis protein
MTAPITATKGSGVERQGGRRTVRRGASRRGLTVIAVALILLVAGPVAASLYSLSQDRVYGGQIDVLFMPGADRSDGAAEREMFTQQVLVRNPAVLEPVAPVVGISLPDLQEAISVGVVEQSNVLRITVAGSDPVSATRAAQAVADEYVRVSARTSPGSRVDELYRARPLKSPLSPQPLRAAAAGAIAGMLAAACSALVLLRPRHLLREHGQH